ncbi:hypothetical protein PSCFBP3800_02925 [Pseudomonas syringae group genomosp. 3]|nr:hypothetical protein PSCFBP3800_02925 [Pseudomonas syringae group genomosp. 3]
MRNTVLSCNDGCVIERPAYKDSLSPQGHSFHYIRPTSYTAIKHDHQIRRGLDDPWQNQEGRYAAVQLTSAMIRHNDSIGTNGLRGFSIFWIQNPFDDQCTSPPRPNLDDMA